MAQPNTSAGENIQTDLNVFQLGNDRYFVESSNGNICYKVHANNGKSACTCSDYAEHIKKDEGYVCKHIHAVMNCNGNAAVLYPEQFRNSSMPAVPKLNDQFITRIKGKEFVVYSGILDLAHQRGLAGIIVEVVQFPTKENGMEAICRAIITSNRNERYIEFGDANPNNVNAKIAAHMLRMAGTRAKARALRDFTNIGMTCLEELAETDDVIGSKGTPKKSTTPNKTASSAKKPSETGSSKSAKKPAESKSSAKSSKPKTAKPGKGDPTLSTAQKKAILNLAGRRGIPEDELEKMASETFGVSFEYLSPKDASVFIRNLQQAA